MLGFCFVGFVCTVSLVSDFVFQILYSSIPVSCFRLQTSVFLFVVADSHFAFRDLLFACRISDFRFPILYFQFTASHYAFLLTGFGA